MNLLCEACGRPIPSENVNVLEGFCHCASCNQVFQIASSLSAEDRLWRVEKPSFSLVRLFERGDGLEMTLPPGGMSGGGVSLALFAVLWNSFVWFVAGGFLSVGSVFPLLLISIFVIFGAVFAISALQLLVGTFTLRLDQNDCVGSWKLFGQGYSKRRRTEEIVDVVEAVVYTRNYQPMYGVGIEFRTAKALKFGSTLSEDERKWIVGELRQWVKELRASNPKHG